MGNRIFDSRIPYHLTGKKYGLAKNMVGRKFYGKAPASHLPVLYRKKTTGYFLQCIYYCFIFK